MASPDSEKRFLEAVEFLNNLHKTLSSHDPVFRKEENRDILGEALDRCMLAIHRTPSPKPGSRESYEQRLRQRRKKPDDINVLIVDDDLVAARLLSNQLRKLKVRNEFVLSGVEALEKLYENPHAFQLILCDVNMPGLGGGEVLCHILEDEVLKHIPIVMVSSDTDLEKAKQLVSAGAKDYIVKPIRQIALVSLSFKVSSWAQGNPSRQLQALYNVTNGLLLFATIVWDEPSNDNSLQVAKADRGDGTGIRKLIVSSASVGMKNLFGITQKDIENGKVDVFDYVLPEEHCILKLQAIQVLASANSGKPKDKNVVFRWVDCNGHHVPVVATWCVVGAPENSQVLLETSSLLPSLMLKREKERRRIAEKQARDALTQTLQLKQDLTVSKKTDKSMRTEIASIMCEVSEFSKMLTENPRVLTWRVDVKKEKIDFVNAKACVSVLGFESDELVGTDAFELVHPDDVEKAREAFTDINKSTRIRRRNKAGEYVVLESRAYAWFDNKQTVVVITEYDITNLLHSPNTLPS
mmetsp:Transcript_5285/g.8133  ORF Transcript_5285/g.8133 Transcript_5285/m.8133 type:complete len:524 (+) Transcript_5285:104-1675(+)